MSKPVENGSSRNDGSTVLVIVKHRNIHPLAQLVFDFETLGCLDVLKVDAAKGRL